MFLKDNLIKYKRFIILALLLFMFIICVTSIINLAVTYDEVCFLGGGRYLIENNLNIDGRVDLGIYIPPMSLYISSIPIFFMEFDDSIWNIPTCWDVGKELIFHSKYDQKNIVFLSRLPIILLLVIGGIFIYLWSKDLYGVNAGLFALFLYAFNISIIGVGRLIFTDSVFIVFFIMTLYYFWKYLKNNKTSNLIISGVTLGLAMLSKVNGIYLIPIFVLWFLIYKKINLKKSFFKRMVPLFIIFLLSYLTIFIAYGFKIGTISSTYPEHYNQRVREVFNEYLKSQDINSIATFLYEKVPIPAPAYLSSIGHAGSLSLAGIKGYFFGKILEIGEKPVYYDLVLILIKTQVPLLLLFIMTLLFIRKLKFNLKDEMFLLTPVVFIFIIFSLNRFSFDIKHLLPIYPLLFIFVSKLVNIKFLYKKQNKLFNVILIMLSVWYILSTLLAYPFYLSYFNEFIGGSKNGYKYLSGANIDQGQDIYRLKEYLDENNIGHIWFSFHGAQDPSLFGINHTYLPSGHWQVWVPEFVPYKKDFSDIEEDCTEKQGIVVISTTNLQNRFTNDKTCFNWLNEYKPIKRVGYSLFVYNVTKI